MSVGTNDPLRSQNLSQSNAYALGVYGMAIVDHGLVVQGQINGFGLLTDGLVWMYGEIWFDSSSVDGITTSWSDIASVTTTWVPSGGPEFLV